MFKDLSGSVFGKLTVIGRSGTEKYPNGSSMPVWHCQCECGNTIDVVRASLTKGSTKSCGCLRIQATISKNTKHGLSKSPEHVSWTAMMSRCYRETDASYSNYGAKGILVCEYWKKFENFLEDMGSRPVGTSLDRIDSTKNYEPDNCRWSTIEVQNRNTSRNKNITLKGITRCLSEWAREFGISRQTLTKHISKYGEESLVTKFKM